MDHALHHGGRPGQPSGSDRPRLIPPRPSFRDPVTFQSPLTEPECALVDILDQSLSAEWTIFVRPHIGIAQPTAIVFSPYRRLALLGLVGDGQDRRDVIGRLGACATSWPSYSFRSSASGSTEKVRTAQCWVAAISERAVSQGQLDPALIDDIADAPVEFDFRFTAALERLLGDRWIEPRHRRSSTPIPNS